MMSEAQGINLNMLVFIMMRAFIDGCENLFILPTVLYYIKSLGQAEQYMGIVVISYYVSSLITTPLIGRIADRFDLDSLLIIFSIALKVLGNLFYSINTNAAFPLVGRILSGMGQASHGLLLRQVVLNIPEKRRAGIFVIADGAYCLGTTFGPAVGSFLVFNANVFGWKINAGNSPGIILCCIWFVYLIWSILLSGKFEVKSNWVNVNLSLEELTTLSYSEEVDTTAKVVKSQDKAAAKLWDDFNSNVLCLFYITFCSESFSSIALFSTPLFAQEILHLQLIHVKLYFLNCSLINFGLFLATYIFSSYFEERNVVVFFVVLEMIALSLLSSLVLTWDHSYNIQYYILLLYITLGSSYWIFSQCCSLLSKITNPRNAGFFQGSSVATIHIAYTISRISISLVFTHFGMIYFTFGLIVLWFIGAVWYSFTYSKLTVKRDLLLNSE